MLLNAEELLALANGDAEPDRLADLLDRLERCPASAEALQVLVTLKANRHEALAALREAADSDARSTPIPHPAARRATFSADWGLPALRVAATVAIVVMLGLWGASSYFGTVDTAAMATTTLRVPLRPAPRLDVELTGTAADGAELRAAYDALTAGDYATARRALESMANEPHGRVALYLGITYYFQQDYHAALDEFVEIRSRNEVPLSVRHIAGWYQANALLALDSPMNAIGVLEDIKGDDGYPFQEDALATYDELREALGLTPAHR